MESGWLAWKKRSAKLGFVEYRDDGFAKAKGSTISGYAAVFNSPTVIGNSFRERLAPGCFSQSLRTDDQLALLDHDTGRLLGRVSSGTLRLKEDHHGLYFSLDLATDTPDGQTALALVKRGDLAGMSFGFVATDSDWSEEDRPLPLRTIRAAHIFEVSAVASPAYDATSIALGRSKPAPKASRTAANAAIVRKAQAAMKARGIE